MEDFKRNLIKRAYIYAREIIKFIDKLNNRNFSLSIIMKQLLRSATSVGANIIEAQAASSKKDFTNYLNHALKSANESKFWLFLLKDSKQGNPDECEHLFQETKELANILASCILTLKGKKNF